MDCQGLVARLVMDFVLLTTAVEVAGRWRELAERLTKVSRLQMDAYEAPHRDKNGMVDSEVSAALQYVWVWEKSKRGVKNLFQLSCPKLLTYAISSKTKTWDSWLHVYIRSQDPQVFGFMDITQVVWQCLWLELGLCLIVFEPSTVIVACFKNFASSITIPLSVLTIKILIHWFMVSN